MSGQFDDLPRPIAFVFGGGGSYGSVQVGQLRAVQRAGIVPDFTVGTSVGSLHAAAVAENPEVAGDRLSAIWSGVTRETVFGTTAQAMRNTMTMQSHIANPKSVRKMITDALVARDFNELQLPMIAVAADAVTGDIAQFSSGDLISALVASIAIPGVFPEVERDGGHYIDGGVLANVPIGVAAQNGANTIVVFDAAFALFAPRTTPTLGHTILRAAAMFTGQQVKVDLALHQDRTILYVPGNWPPAARPWEFGKTQENNVESYEIAKKWLSELDVDGPGVYGSPPQTMGRAEPETS